MSRGGVGGEGEVMAIIVPAPVPLPFPLNVCHGHYCPSQAIQLLSQSPNPHLSGFTVCVFVFIDSVPLQRVCLYNPHDMLIGWLLSQCFTFGVF